MTKPSILVIGSSNTDMIITLKRIPAPGETLLGGHFSTAAGGKGANQAVAAARSGGRTTFIAKLGNDIFGDQALTGFQEDCIDTSLIQRDPEQPSGVALIFVAQSGENSIAVASGSNARLTPDDIRAAEASIASAEMLVMQLETPMDTIAVAAQLARKHKVPVILNPAPAAKLPPELLRCLTLITPNETETEVLTGVKVIDESSAKRASDILRSKGVQTVIITCGSQGAWICDDSGVELIPSFPVKAVDSTAAGDTFNGALSVALAEGKSLKDAVLFANAAGALSVTKPGAQPSIPTREEIELMMHEHAVVQEMSLR